MMIKVHFIDNNADKIIAKKYVSIIPNVDDELRFSDDIFYKVVLIVFVYDQ